MNFINTILNEDCRTGLKNLPDNSVDCCVTSPPYYGLRDYGTAKWEGGDSGCDHVADKARNDRGSGYGRGVEDITNMIPFADLCGKCGARRIDSQIGLEETPETYVATIVEVFREVKRVLKKEGTLWLNLGDSYNGSGGAGSKEYAIKNHTEFGKPFNMARYQPPTKVQHLKPKDLIGIPWLVAFALRSDGWYLRQDIIWHKPNPMPESVTDRCTKAHEYIFLMSKSGKYYYDAEAIKDKSIWAEKDKRFLNGSSKGNGKTELGLYSMQSCGAYSENGMANKRSVWTVTTQPYPDAHFATFPQELITDCIKAGCPEGGIVLDPFMGAGTTAVVARKLNRNYVGFELNSNYIKLAERRLYKEIGMFL